MVRPRLFLSTVSEELRTARQAVARTVRTLGFDPVSQDDFPTGHGELRQWLREQLDSSEGLIQLVGDGYGAEPPEVDPEYGRISYTQFEFLYVYKQKKKTWIIVIGKDFPRDKAPDQLDLPRDSNHQDPTGYQMERRTLQREYLATLKQNNHLRHTALNGTELDNIVLRLRDELGELRQEWEEWKQRIETKLDSLAQITTEKIRTHLLQTAQETLRHELAEAAREKDWKRRQQLRDAADRAQTVRLSRIEELATSFAEIEGKGTATNVFEELTRILAEQGVDEAIAYVESQRGSILQVARSLAVSAHERIRAELRPLLNAAGLYQAMEQTAEAHTLYAEILDAEPEWPEALYLYFWFLADQGDFACIRTSVADARPDYEKAHLIAERLVRLDPINSEWQWALSVSHERIGDTLAALRDFSAALNAYQASLEITKNLVIRSPTKLQWKWSLAVIHNKISDVREAQGEVPNKLKPYLMGIEMSAAMLAPALPNSQWQRDLIVRYVKQSEVSGDNAYLARALEVAQAIQQSGALDSRDAWIVDELKRRLG